MNYLFDQERQKKFRSSLQINYQRACLGEQNKNDFESFWNYLLGQQTENVEVFFQRLNKIKTSLSEGPLKSWIEWLEGKAIVFIFEDSNFSIKDLVYLTKLDSAYLLKSLHEHLEGPGVSPTIFENKILSQSDLKFSTFPPVKKLSLYDQTMVDLEVTAFDEWAVIESFFLNRSYHREKSDFKILIPFFVTLVIGVGMMVLSLKVVKLQNLKILSELKISIPSFELIDTDEISPGPLVGQNNLLGTELDEEASLATEETVEEERFGTESEVILTSDSELSESLKGIKLGSQEYEELRKGGFRDTRYGRRNVYRVMIESGDTVEARESISFLMKNYNAEKGDRVEPGKYVPGGVYYNLFVPNKNLTLFFDEIKKSLKPSIYLTRSRAFNPPGKTKVFIWVKKI